MDDRTGIWFDMLVLVLIWFIAVVRAICCWYVSVAIRAFRVFVVVLLNRLQVVR